MDTEQRAIRAQQLIEDPLLCEVLEQIEKAAIDAWQATKTDNVAQREFSWLTVKVVNRIRDALQGVVDNQLIEASIAARAPR